MVQWLTAIGWAFLLLWIFYLGRLNRRLTNQQFATLGAFVALQFILQILVIPFFGLPLAIGLTGIPLTVLILGYRRGLFVSLTASILSSFLIPGFFASLGINVLNSVVAATLALLPIRYIYKKRIAEGLKVNRKIVFLGAMIYQLVEGLAIVGELFLSGVFTSQNIFAFFMALVMLIGFIEAFVTIGIYRIIEPELLKEVYLGPRQSIRTLPKVLRDDRYKHLEFDPLGRFALIDTRSKILVTTAMITAVAISTELYQEILIFLMSFPLIFIYRPSIRFLSRIAIAIPFVVLVVIVVYIGFEGTNFSFALKLGFRYFVSITHSSILLESEPSYFELIEALRGLKIPSSITTTLLISLRLASRLWEDYSTMKSAIASRGAPLSFGITKSWGRVLNTYRILLSNLSNKGLKYSKSLNLALEERGFHGILNAPVEPFTSEGLTMFGLFTMTAIVVVLSKFWI